jgi:hypothetical protein
MKTNNLTPVQWYSLKSEDLRGKLTLGAITITQYYEELNIILGVALEMEKQQIIDASNQEICLHLDKEFVPGVFGGYWCPKCNRNVDSELEQD